MTPYPAFSTVPAEAGATRLVPAGATSVRLTIALPEGWEKAGDAMVVKSGGASPAGMSISAWHLAHVNVFPCRWSSQEFADASLLNSAVGQAQALSGWWGQDPLMPPKSNAGIAPIASKPRHTTIQGYAAWYIEVLIPREFNLDACDGAQLVLWDSPDGGVRYGLEPGELDRLWVVDVDGDVIVIDAASSIATPAADLAELDAILESIGIES